MQIGVDVFETPPMAIESAIPEGLSSDASPPSNPKLRDKTMERLTKIMLGTVSGL